jgi:hypothetical protein
VSYIDELKKRYTGKASSLNSLIDETNAYYAQKKPEEKSVEITNPVLKLMRTGKVDSPFPTIPMKGASLPQSETDPTVGDNLFLVNQFPIRQNDNLGMKVLKGAGNFGLSLLSAPGELARQTALQFGSIASGNGIAQTPKNTSFVGDIFPKSASEKLKGFEQSHPVVGGLTNALIETATDPMSYITGNTVAKAIKPENGFEQAAKSIGKVSFPELEFTQNQQIGKTVSNLNPQTYKFTTGEQRAMAELEEGILTAQNFVGHNDVLAKYPPGTTIEQAYV